MRAQHNLMGLWALNLFGKADLIAEDVLDGPWTNRLIVVESESDRGMVRRFQLAMGALLARDPITEGLSFQHSDELLRLQGWEPGHRRTLRATGVGLPTIEPVVERPGRG